MGRSQEGHSPRGSKEPLSAGASRKTIPQHIKRTASVDNLDVLNSVPSALERRPLSGKVSAKKYFIKKNCLKEICGLVSSFWSTLC